jgi:hypothetical protein
LDGLLADVRLRSLGQHVSTDEEDGDRKDCEYPETDKKISFASCHHVELNGTLLAADYADYADGSP